MKILIIDIETTGFSPQSDKIVEVGIVELDLETGEIKTILDKVCQELPMKLEDIEKCWVVEKGFMKADEIMLAPELNSILADIQNIISEYHGATAFNRNFDFSFLKARGIKFNKELPCPMLLSTDICKIQSARGYKWPKAQEAYDFFFPNSEYIEKHRGADDAVHEAEIVFELYKRGVFKID